MPELPEVETIRRQLHARLQGATIEGVELFYSCRERPSGQVFVQGLVGQVITTVDRRAKLLIWRLKSGQAIIAHLKMTGRFLFVNEFYTPTKHDAIRFLGHDKKERRFWLIWSDVRKFGFMEVVTRAELEKKLAEYGPEPLECSPNILAECLESPKTRLLKAALLNQSCIAGVGNIYADEACFRAGIHPNRRLGTLRTKERLRLAKEIQAVLTESIAQQGTSAHTYVDTMGSPGGFVAFLRVYDREGELCVNCKTPIQKIRLAQRGTHVCPSCQTEST